jgi:hypothetical protein
LLWIVLFTYFLCIFFSIWAFFWFKDWDFSSLFILLVWWFLIFDGVSCWVCLISSEFLNFEAVLL